MLPELLFSPLPLIAVRRFGVIFSVEPRVISEPESISPSRFKTK